MAEITLPLVTLRHKGEQVQIFHRAHKFSVTVGTKQLESWALRQLRADLEPPKMGDKK